MLTTIPRLCGSVAGKPSALGVKLHNAGYEATGLPFTYLAIGADNITSTFSIAKSLNFRGLAVSMPHKISVIELLDQVSDDVKSIGACNTVVFDESVTTGYNTDWLGAQDALNEVSASKPKTALIIGAGGAARAIAYCLRSMDAQVYIAARRPEQANKLVNDLGLTGAININAQSEVHADLIVNATPEAAKESSPVDADALSMASIFFDVVFNELETPIIRIAKEKGLAVVPGWRMLLHQACHQFRLYTGVEPPVEPMANVLRQAFQAR